MTDAEDQGTSDRRPTPVRAAMDSAESVGQTSGAPDRTFLDPGDGQEWVARVVGRSRSGVIPLRIISLMEVGFSRVEEPNLQVRRNLCQGDSLDAMSEEELIGLLRDADPVSESDAQAPARESRGRRRRSRRRS
jgi:hypothetical protein